MKKWKVIYCERKFCGITSALGYSDSEARDKVIQDFGKGGISFSPINLFLSVSEN